MKKNWRRYKKNLIKKLWIVFGVTILGCLLVEYFNISTLKIVVLGIFLFMLFVIAIYYFIALIINAIKRHQYLNSSLYQIDRMTGEQFEQFLAVHFQAQQYKVKLTPKNNDYGADLILIKKDCPKTIVQAKKRFKKPIGIKAIQEIVGAKNYYQAEKCMVVTNSYFTENAINLAKANQVELWNRKRLTREFPSIIQNNSTPQ